MKLLFILFSTLLLSACAGSTTVESTPVSSSPVTGIYVTSESSPIVMWTWRNPPPIGAHAGISAYLDLPFPNPTSDAINFDYTNPQEAHVKLWVSTASMEGGIGVTTVGGVAVPRPDEHVVATLVDDVKYAGRYLQTYSLKDADGNLLPSGFYRIYAQINDHLFWRDFAVCRNPADFPCSIIKQ